MYTKYINVNKIFVTWYAIRERGGEGEVNTLTPLFDSTVIKTDR